MRIDGGCHCGAITYRAEIDPGRVGICHCTDCQALSGAPYRASVVCEEADLTLLTGTPATYVKTADSGRKREQAFCRDCGSPIWSTSVGEGPRHHRANHRGSSSCVSAASRSGPSWCRSASPSSSRRCLGCGISAAIPS